MNYKIEDHLYTVIKDSKETLSNGLSIGDVVEIKDYINTDKFYEKTTKGILIPGKCLLLSKIYELDKILKDL